jgi:hypothetical protein
LPVGSESLGVKLLRLSQRLTTKVTKAHEGRPKSLRARDILITAAASSSDWIDSRSSLNIMISVSNVSMRYGAKVLFDEVSTGFVPGKRYGLTGPNGAGKSTFMKLLTGELEPQKGTVVRPRKLGVLSQDQFAFDKYRVIDAVIMGNRRLWAALEEREIIYAKHEMTDADGMKLGELEGIVGEEDGYTAEATPRFCCRASTFPTRCTSAKCRRFRAAKRCACCWRRLCSGIRRRCCSTSLPTISISIRSTG